VAMANPAEIYISEVAERTDRQATLRGFNSAVTGLAISPFNLYITSVHDDRTVRTWSAAGGKEAYKPWQHTAQVNQVAYLPGGSSIVAVCQDGVIRRWDGAKGTEQWLVRRPDVKQLACLSFQKDGTRFATGDRDGYLRVWEAADGSLVQGFQAEKGNGLAAVALSPDGELAVSATANGRIRLWNLAEMQAPAAAGGAAKTD
jgi:WD40 repeat protein